MPTCPQPLVRTATLMMLAFCLAVAGLLFYLSTTSPSAPVADSYTDKAFEAKLARGLGWLHQALRADNLPPPTAAVSDCKGLKDPALFDCRRNQINQRLAQVTPVKQLAGPMPDAENLPAVLTAQHWLLRYSSTPGKLATLLEQGEYAARQRLLDPFRLSGCITWAGADDPCESSALAIADDLPQHADQLTNSLARYSAAWRGKSPNLTLLHAAPALDTPILQGRHATLALDHNVHDMAQITAACYTGNATACDGCPWCNTKGAADMYEHARARSMGILVVDAKTGGILAAASAFTPCFEAQQRGWPPGPGCPQLPNTPLPHLDRLGNQAMERQAKPGSTTKIVIALALQKVGLSAAEAADLPGILTYSKTPELIDIVMCKARHFDPVCAQTRLTAIANMAHALGWGGRNADLLGANQIPGLEAARFTARLLHQADGKSMTDHLRLTRDALAQCSKRIWHGCADSGGLSRVVAELFGTGEALATPVGVTNALLQVAAAANHPATAPKALPYLVPQAHLVQTWQEDGGAPKAVRPVMSMVLSPAQTSPVLAGLLLGVTLGSAASACRAAAEALPGGLLPCVSTSTPRMRIAGKTGTPVASMDLGKDKSMTLNQWRTKCTKLRQTWAQTPKSHAAWFTLQNEVGKCDAQPTKWYSFLASAPGSQTWDLIVSVQVERNWNAGTGLIDSPNDVGTNVAAEAGLAFVNALYHPALALHKSL